MTIFYILLAVYLLSIVGAYSLMKYIYVHSIPIGLAQVWSWIVPVVNTGVVIAGFFLCWKYFPITGLPFWKKRWDKSAVHIDSVYVSLFTKEKFDKAMETFPGLDSDK